jgi:hypothetical protein
MLLIGEYETKSSVTAAFNWRRANWTIADEAVDIGGLKLGGDHASVPKLRATESSSGSNGPAPGEANDLVGGLP